MPVRKVLLSSMSGNEIPEGTGARVRVMWNNREWVDLRGDLTDAEAEALIKRYKLAEVQTRPERRGERRIRL